MKEDSNYILSSVYMLILWTNGVRAITVRATNDTQWTSLKVCTSWLYYKDWSQALSNGTDWLIYYMCSVPVYNMGGNIGIIPINNNRLNNNKSVIS